MRRRQYFLTAIFAGISTGMMTLAGCGGGGRSTTPLTNAGFRAAAIAGNQSMAGIRSYPFAAIRDAAPKGSTLFGTRAAVLRPKGRLDTPLTYDSSLGLYKLYTVTGNTTNVSYFSDAAGTVGAGTASITEPGLAAFTTDYASYPATINIAVNTTSGNLVCSGSGSIVFSAPSGTNTLTGNFNFSRDGVAVRGTVALNASDMVSGAFDITENGATLHLTNVAGSLSGIITANVRIDPNGATGTGTFNVQTGAFSLTINTGKGESGSAGGAGGTGGAPGNGVGGGVGNNSAGNGNIGANGGSGGNGGGGAGGNGGPSVCVYSSAAPTYTNNTCTRAGAGKGGLGAGTAPKGPDGVDGEKAGF